MEQQNTFITGTENLCVRIVLYNQGQNNITSLVERNDFFFETSSVTGKGKSLMYVGRDEELTGK